MGSKFSRVAAKIVVHKKRVHIAVFILTLLMIPGALTALQPIDMESYEMESPELSAQTTIDDEFPTSEIILGFVVAVRDPNEVEPLEEWEPVATVDGGTPDYASIPPISDILEPGKAWKGVTEPDGGILNLTILKEIDAKAKLVLEHPLGGSLKPLVNEVTGHQTGGVMSLADIFRGFMNNTSILTQPGLSPLGIQTPPPTNWTDCFPLNCLSFDDENITQAHIDMAAARMAEGSNNDFLRWISLDRGFVSDFTSIQEGPIGGTLDSEGNWQNETNGPGRWSGSASWLLVQLDRASLEEQGWEVVWKDAKQEKSIRSTDDGFVIGGYRIANSELVLHPPQYDKETCTELVDEEGAGCSVEWSYMDLEGTLRSQDRTSLTLLVGQGVNVEVNRELQASTGLIILMGLIILGLLYVSLRRLSDVAIVVVALGGALLWMQGLIGHFSSFTNLFGISIIARSQFSNLLPILVLALGIDDSLHALHRYKEERRNGKSPTESGTITLNRVGRAILLTSITTMAAFSANLFSDIAALRSFGVEAAMGILAAFLLTGLWVPILRLSVDEWLEKKKQKKLEEKQITHLVPERWLRWVTIQSGRFRNSFVLATIALLVTIPASIAMSNLEGDFAVEDFLDESSDFAQGVNIVNERFSDEGEPAMLLIEGDVLDPRVYEGIDLFRTEMNSVEEGVPEKITRTPDGNIDLLAIDELLFAAQGSLILDPEPFKARGWNPEIEGNGMNCTTTQIGFLDTSDRDCLAFMYGFLTLEGVPGIGPIPSIPSSIVSLYIMPEVELNPVQPWLDVNGEPAQYNHMLIRFGITGPEDFPSMGPAMDELWRDLEVFTNLSTGTQDTPGTAPTEEKPLTWVMTTGRPVTRFVASTEMQNEMQSSLVLGSVFVFISLAIGFRSIKQALVTLGPILLVVVWLYGLMQVTGASLNIVTVTIATISLGVGIDYCIHVTERYRESREKGESHEQALHAVGGACGLALIGSAASDIAGFSVIALSPMGLFSNFGIFSAAMIFLSLIASLVLTTAALGLLHQTTKIGQREEE